MKIGGWAAVVLGASLVGGCASASSATAGADAPTGEAPRSTPVGTPPAEPTTAASPPSASSDGRQITGIPETFDDEPVLLGVAAAAHAEESADATPFLIGGWFNDATVAMCSGGIGRDPAALLSGCATGIGPAAPGGTFNGVGTVHVFWDGHTLPNGRAPSILRVHTHDPRTSECRPESRDSCRRVVVVEDVLWSGDPATETAPISVIDAVQTLGAMNLQTSFQTGPMEYLAVTRRLFTAPLDAPCPAPWPRHVFALHGDPQFGLLAVFPNEGERMAAQAALDANQAGCAVDPKVVRPGPAAFAARANVLAIVYGEPARARMQGALDGTIDRDMYLPLPGKDLDESYRVVADAQAARAAGDLTGFPLLPPKADDVQFDAAVADMYDRSDADALRYVIDAGGEATEAAVGGDIWAQLTRWAVTGTGKLYVVEHPFSTDPALREERIVASRLKEPSVDTWAFLVLP